MTQQMVDSITICSWFIVATLCATYLIGKWIELWKGR